MLLMVYSVCAAIQVAHVTPDVAFLKLKDGRLAHDWAAAQVATTADFAHGSFFWTHFSGGLNYQVSQCTLAPSGPWMHVCCGLCITGLLSSEVASSQSFVQAIIGEVSLGGRT